MMAVQDAEVVVIGSGVAGLSAALALDTRSVTLLTKTAALAGGASPLAQGGIAAAIGPGDDPDLHARDTVAAGAGLVDEAMARLLAEEGAARVRALIADGLPVDRDEDGALRLGREAAHGVDRIVHADGDATGRALVAALVRRVTEAPWVRVATSAMAVEVVVRGGRVCGVLAHGPGGWVFHRSGRVILATGGVGGAYGHTTNPVEATGDGLALAARAGARLADLEFVQFHPTALAGHADPAPLLTEALRGAGAWLVDAAGRRFMEDEHPLAELAPRDVVARAIHRRIVAGRPVFLDLRPALERRPGGFPTALAICAAAGLDPQRTPVPVAPAAHYHMGGVATNRDGRTSVDGLWACGEVACTGVHGANRLASNSLLEGLVFGVRAARDAAGRPLPCPPPVACPSPPRLPGAAAAERIAGIVAQARRTLDRHAGIERDALGLRTARERLDGLAAALASLPEEDGEAADAAAVRRWAEARNRLLAGRLIVHAASARTESRGAHRRTDAPASASRAERFTLTLDALAAPAGPAPAPGAVACPTP